MFTEGTVTVISKIKMMIPLLLVTASSVTAYGVSDGRIIEETESPAVRLINKRGDFFSGTNCTGVRISEDHVLTAAHCLLAGWEVGGNHWPDVGYMTTVKSSNRPNSIQVRRQIESVKLHPTWDGDKWAIPNEQMSTAYALGIHTPRMTLTLTLLGRIDMALVKLAPLPATQERTDDVIIKKIIDRERLKQLSKDRILAEAHGFGYFNLGEKWSSGELNGAYIRTKDSMTGKLIDFSHGHAGKVQSGDSGGPALLGGSRQYALLGILSLSAPSLSEMVRGRVTSASYVPAYRVCDFDLSAPDLRLIQQQCAASK